MEIINYWQDLNQFWALKNLNAPIEHWITLNKSLLLDESENLNKKLKESSNKPHKTPLIDVDREMPRVGADLKVIYWGQWLTNPEDLGRIIFRKISFETGRK